MHLLAEHIEFILAVVPAVVGTEHLVVLPHVGSVTEIGGGKVAPIL